MSSVNIYPATITVADDGSVHIAARSRVVFLATKRFTPAEAIRIRDWLAKADWERNLDDIHINDSIAYSHETGLLTISTLGAQESFDPNKEESLAKMVRLLKRRAPTLHAEAQREIPSLLPTPTEEELARRTIYTNAANADGSGYRSRPKARFMEPSIGAERTKQVATDILNMLVKQQVG